MRFRFELLFCAGALSVLSALPAQAGVFRLDQFRQDHHIYLEHDVAQGFATVLFSHADLTTDIEVDGSLDYRTGPAILIDVAADPYGESLYHYQGGTFTFLTEEAWVIPLLDLYVVVHEFPVGETRPYATLTFTLGPGDIPASVRALLGLSKNAVSVGGGGTWWLDDFEPRTDDPRMGRVPNGGVLFITTVPEPSLGLLIAGGAVAVVRRRRQQTWSR